MISGFSPSRTEVNAPTKTGGTVTDAHQFSGSIFITSSLMSISIRYAFVI